MMDEQLERCLHFLRAANTELMPHTQRGLFDHLLGTRQLLVDWGLRLEVCDAGLFHSVYGTEYYQPAAIALSMRAEVRQLIGDEAELLAWLFCTMRRATLFDQNPGRNGERIVQHRRTGEWIPLTDTQFEDLVAMAFANSLEAFPRASWIARWNTRRSLRRYRSIAIPPVQNGFDRFDARPWEFWK
jgi:hypothetical protein